MKTKPRDKEYCGCDKIKIKSANPVLNKKNLAHLNYFIRERYKIHIKKDILKQPPPYTKDPVLGVYRFTNVRREHDRQTIHLIKEISTNKNLTLEEKIINTFLFRSWNNFDTFNSLGGPWKMQELTSPGLKENIRPLYLKLVQEDPARKWWSSAYNQGGTKCAWKFPAGDGYSRAYKEEEAKKHHSWEADIPLRVFHIIPWLISEKTPERLISAKDQQEAFSIIKEIRGFADFLAYQVFVDLTYIKEFPFSENEFTAAGPGCRKGLDYIFDDFDGLTYEEALFWLRDGINGRNLFQRNGLTWNPDSLFEDIPEQDRKMNVMSLENCHCELSKYMRTINNVGRPRVRYRTTIKEEV
ncbi:MAG: putative DNA base hypermodification protein [Niameybacter sp.]